MKVLAAAAALVAAFGMSACGGQDAADGTQQQGRPPASAQERLPRLNLLTPQDGETVRTGEVEVRGTVSPPEAKVQVMGKSATVTDGLFRASVPLDMGSISIDVVATAGSAAPASTSVKVKRGRSKAELAKARAAKKRRQARAAAKRKAKRERARARREAEARRDARAASDSAESGSGDCITVPGVVGEDHQLAQDTMQAAGLYVLDEQDATGQDRMLVFDRNWTVVAQDPSAGQCVSPDATILLSSKKDGE